MEYFSTQGLSPKTSCEYWNDLVSEVFTQMSSDPLDFERFRGELTTIPLGPLSLSKAISTPAHIQHTQHHIARATENVFLLHYQIEGESLNSQSGHEVLLGKGDMTLVDSARPYSLCFETANSMGVLRIPYSPLAERIRYPEDMIGCRLSGDRGVSGLLSQMLRNFWKGPDFSSSELIENRLADNILDMLVTSFHSSRGTPVPSDAGGNIRVIRFKRYIDFNLGDPELSPSSVADTFQITPRYLHKIFSEYNLNDETVGQYILRRRLEECAREFSSPSGDKKKITEIAFQWGFNSMTHFSRVFKDKFGLSPREYRRQF